MPDKYYSGNYSNVKPPPNSLESKWLSTNVADANAWGKKMDFGGNYKIVEITVPRSALNSMYYGGIKLDGIGPAYNATNNILNQYANTIKWVK